jgi:hypothetical protein
LLRKEEIMKKLYVVFLSFFVFLSLSGVALASGSCVGACGGTSPDGCHCDESCVKYGNCCPDYQEVCNDTTTPGASGSCTDACGGQSPDGCYCDELCVEYGDCCPDYQEVCVNAPDINAIITDPTGWTKKPEMCVTVSKQEKYVHGKGPGLLFEYTRSTADLFDENNDWQNKAYTPRASKVLQEEASIDIRPYNRISFWVYVEGNSLESFHWGLSPHPIFKLRLKSGQWYRAVWDLDYDTSYFDPANISTIYFQGVNQGTGPKDCCDTAKIYLSDFKLEMATSAYKEGYVPNTREIITPYTGIFPGEDVSLVVSADHAGRAGEVMGVNYHQPIRVSDRFTSNHTDYACINFKAPIYEGVYYVTIMNGPIETIYVESHPYDRMLTKALNALRDLRSGCDTNLHPAKNTDDAYVTAEGERVDISGGWYDEGAYLMPPRTNVITAGLARFKQTSGKSLYLPLYNEGNRDLLEEIEWGLSTLLKYEVEPDVHPFVYAEEVLKPEENSGGTYVTDNIPGTADDRRIVAKRYYPHRFWRRAEALALAASVVYEPVKGQSIEELERMWQVDAYVDDELRPLMDTSAEIRRFVNTWDRKSTYIESIAQRIIAAIETYKLTKEDSYKEEAIEEANKILGLQEDKRMPGDQIYGYFFKGTLSGHNETIFTGNVNGQFIHLPAKALGELILNFSDHENVGEWERALRRYADGMLRPLVNINIPYGNMGFGPFEPDHPLTELFAGENIGGFLVYPTQFKEEIPRNDPEKLKLTPKNGAYQIYATIALAVTGKALNDDELIKMANNTLRYVFGTNPFHVSYMLHFGKIFPNQIQAPNVPGFFLRALGLTAEGLPYFNINGANRYNCITKAPRFIQLEGSTTFLGCLFEAVSYLEL